MRVHLLVFLIFWSTHLLASTSQLPPTFDTWLVTIRKQETMGQLLRLMYVTSTKKTDQEFLKKEYVADINRKIPEFEVVGNQIKFAGLPQPMVFVADQKRGGFNYKMGRETWHFLSTEPIKKNIDSLTSFVKNGQTSAANNLFVPKAYAESSVAGTIAKIALAGGTSYMCATSPTLLIKLGWCGPAAIWWLQVMATAAFGNELSNPPRKIACVPNDAKPNHTIEMTFADGSSGQAKFDRISGSEVGNVQNSKGERLDRLNAAERYVMMALDNICQEPQKVAQVNRWLKLAGDLPQSGPSIRTTRPDSKATQ